eukprot:COSAG05_NODE_1139_length_5741_cov_7.808401_4_plen_1007_part_01
MGEELGLDDEAEAKLLWELVSEIMEAAAALDGGRQSFSSVDSDLEVKVSRWEFRKDSSGQQCCVYQFDVSGPDYREIFFQRWSKISDFPDLLESWRKRMKIRSSDKFIHKIPTRWTSSTSPVELEKRRTELGVYFTRFNHWAKGAAAQNPAFLSLLLAEDGPIRACLGSGTATMRDSLSRMMSGAPNAQQGWLNWLDGKSVIPYFAAVVPQTVKCGQGEKKGYIGGSDSGTFALYYAPTDHAAHWALSLCGAYVCKYDNSGRSSPSSQRGLHTFQVICVGEQTVQVLFGVSDSQASQEWIHKCHEVQAASFRSWTSLQVKKTVYGALMVANDRTSGEWSEQLDGHMAVQLVNEQNSHEFYQLSGLRPASGVWEKLCEIFAEHEAGDDSYSASVAGSPTRSSSDPGGAGSEEKLEVYAEITNEGKIGFVLDDTHLTVTKIRRDSQAIDIPFACKGMKLVRFGSRKIGTIDVTAEKLEYSSVMKYLKTEDRPLTLIFEHPWQKHVADSGEDVGKAYYYNSYTQENQWEEPEEYPEIEKAARLRRKMRKKYAKLVKVNTHSPWVGYIDSNEQAPYYIHDQTQESQWDEPREGICCWGELYMASNFVQQNSIRSPRNVAAIGQENLLKPPGDGVLTVKVVRAAQLIGASSSWGERTSDPYIELNLGDVKHATKPKSGTCDPEWDEAFRFRITEDMPLSSLKLTAQVWHYNSLKSAMFLGACEVDLPKVMCRGWEHNAETEAGIAFQLKDPHSQVQRSALDNRLSQLAKGKVRSPELTCQVERDNPYGALRLSFHFDLGLSGGPRRPAFPGTVCVSRIDCDNLIAADSNGTSDPYVILKMGIKGNKLAEQKTAVQYKNLNPRWLGHKLQNLQFEVNPDLQAHLLILRIEVWDHNEISRDSFLGGCTVDLCREFEDGWDHNAACTSTVRLSDTEGWVSSKNLKRQMQLRHLNQNQRNEAYGTLRIEMNFRAEKGHQTVDPSYGRALLGQSSSTNSAKAGQLSVEVKAARGSFL